MNYTIFEGTGTVELHLIKMGDNDRDVTVDLSTEDGSAIGTHIPTIASSQGESLMCVNGYHGLIFICVLNLSTY